MTAWQQPCSCLCAALTVAAFCRRIQGQAGLADLVQAYRRYKA